MSAYEVGIVRGLMGLEAPGLWWGGKVKAVSPLALIINIEPCRADESWSNEDTQVYIFQRLEKVVSFLTWV